MPNFSDPMIMQILGIFAMCLLCSGACWLSWTLGRRKGYLECMANVRKKRRAKRKRPNYSDIRVLEPTEMQKGHTEVETVRVVATRAPRFEENQWM